MTNITKCANKNCKIKGSCWRYVARDEVCQSYCDFNDSKVIKNKKECKYYILSKRSAIEDIEEIVIKEV